MNGKTLGHYKVGEQLGRGGMGEVYVSDDLSLDRKVALKFLPDAFTGDPERMARFEREAKLLASLNHPNIAAIYGLEQAEGKRFIVMELVEGETLAQRLSKGPLPVDEALGICKQVAEGLEAAHEKGVIHRDLKPANVMITEGDRVKILDFGLAKALSGETQSADASQSPTLTEAMTQPGIVLGTAAYMSPEQAKGRTVDKRADIWAFGCILYECLTGRRAFEGETVTETLASILKGEPDWNALPLSTSPNIRFVLRRLLDKDTNRRFRDVADVLIQIEEAPSPDAHTPPRSSWLSWTISAICLAAFIVVSYFHFREKPPSSAEPIRFQIGLPDRVRIDLPVSMAVSPNGRFLAFSVAESDGIGRIWIRALGSLEAHSLPGTDMALEGIGTGQRLFWSPDSRFIGFFADGKLKRIDVAGSQPQTVCSLSASMGGGSWNRDGVIIFGTREGLMRVPAADGIASFVTKTKPAKGDIGHGMPQFLSDGRHFLYLCPSTPEDTGIYVGTLDARPEEQPLKKIAAVSSGFVYVRSPETGRGHLLFLREQTLVAQPFDEKRLELNGEPISIAEKVESFSVSGNGVLLYRARSSGKQLTWVDRAGKELSIIGEANGRLVTFDLTKDGSRLVVSRSLSTEPQNLWVIDLIRNMPTRLTLESVDHTDPRWSPDGNQVIFGSTSDPSRSPFRVSLTSDPVQVFKFTGKRFGLDDWSPDGWYLLYHDTGMRELWASALAVDQKPMLVIRSLSGIVDQAQFSPDGRWIAYNTNESGRFDVKVAPFPRTGEKWQISTAGGVQPTWRGNGSELYFLAPDSTLMAVNVRSGKTFEYGTPHPLFKTQLTPSYSIEEYHPAPDGNRFLLAKYPVDSSQSPFTVILNWTSLLKK